MIPKINIRKKLLFNGVLIHIGIIWLSLSLGYNTYKEAMQYFSPLSRIQKDSIKVLFPYGILIFLFFYVCLLYKKTKRQQNNIFLPNGNYVSIFLIYATLINLIFFSKGMNILIPFNLSIVYSVIFFVIFIFFNRCSSTNSGNTNLKNIQEWLPPIFYRFLMNNLPVMKENFSKRPSIPFIISFFVLIFGCSLFLIIKENNAAENIANIGFLMLFVGVIIELYALVRHKDSNN